MLLRGRSCATVRPGGKARQRFSLHACVRVRTYGGAALGALEGAEHRPLDQPFFKFVFVFFFCFGLCFSEATRKCDWIRDE